MVKITSSLIAAAGVFVGSALAQVVVHRPEPIISGGTQIVSATVLGVTALETQANGATLYAATEVESLLVYASGGRTSTLLSTPTTLVVTFAEGASYYSASAADATTIAGRPVSVGAEVVCTPSAGTNGQVKCVQANVVSALDIATTISTNFVAVTTPIFTLGAQAVPTDGSGSSDKDSSAGYMVHALSAASLSFVAGFMSILLRVL